MIVVELIRPTAHRSCNMQFPNKKEPQLLTHPINCGHKVRKVEESMSLSPLWARGDSEPRAAVKKGLVFAGLAPRRSSSH